ncbi:TPA: hypothetical protein ACPP6V_001286 [Haemophilus influenzae]
MEKLYKLKKWLTIDEATHRLSIETGEEVTNADVLQLAADEQLRISVNFPHNWTRKTCDLTTDENIVKQNKKEIIGFDGNPFIYSEYERCSETEYIKIDDNVREFKAGIWELKLIGNEKIDLEWQLKEEYGLPVVDVFNLNGFYVKNKDGIVIERQTRLSPDEYLKLQKEIRNDTKKQLAKADIPELEKDHIREIIDTKKFENTTFSYPCAGLGEIDGAFFVIQTEHLNEFLANLDDDTEHDSKLDINNTMYLLGEVLQVVGARAKKWTQSEIINKILERRQNENISAKGLKQRTIEEYFANANKRLKP